MLVGALGIKLHMAGKMDLPVFADDAAGLVDDDRRIEMLPLGREFRVAERETHAERPGPIKQRLRCRIRHVRLEPVVGFGPVLVVPARKEGRERKLGIDDEVCAFGLVHQGYHALDHGLACVRLLDRTELGAGDIQDAGHAEAPRME